MTGLAGGVREGQNLPEKWPQFGPPGAPQWAKDTGNELKSIRGSEGGHLGSISFCMSLDKLSKSDDTWFLLNANCFDIIFLFTIYKTDIS